jgi:hypothetical protein
MAGDHVFKEGLSSNRTEGLFVALTILFLSIFVWRIKIVGAGFLTSLLLFFFIFFLFYAINYRTLYICFRAEDLILRFGIFKWTVSFSNIEHIYLDKTSLWRIGGAGIHFTMIGGKYRVYFNFLDYPRVVISLKKKKGLVREIAFSTKQSNEIMSIIREMSV